ncbi:GNAT family N-acetyltransferase [Sphingorhabdus contaminans]|uniref:GNAT family N-acetyltransferase n=1 Tax=Sphingorhabdus contaminans TaxID=1343899 RepID=UPI003D26ED94
MCPPFDIQPTLVGTKVYLRPLAEDDFDALYTVASDPDIWAMHPYRDRYKREVFEGFFAEAIASRGAFAILDQSTGAMIGSSRFANYDAEASEIEIGWTFFACSHWRGGFNREAKALMLRHIFPHINTVVFQIGAHNLRSRKAVERLGARLIRNYVREYRGQKQDYVMYNLTLEEAQTGALALALALALENI